MVSEELTSRLSTERSWVCCCVVFLVLLCLFSLRVVRVLVKSLILDLKRSSASKLFLFFLSISLYCSSASLSMKGE